MSEQTIDHDASRMPLTSPDILGERMEQLRELIPEAFSEGEIDFDRLRQALGDFVVWAGTSLSDSQEFCKGSPSTKLQMKLSNLPNSSCTARNAFALLMAESILSRFRTIPAFPSRLACFFFPYIAMRAGSNWSNALR